MQKSSANQMASWFQKVLSPTPQNLVSTVLVVVYITVSQERLQPMSDGKCLFIAGYLLCYSYKLKLIGPGIFHRAIFEK